METGRIGTGEVVIPVSPPNQQFGTFIGFVTAGGTATVINYGIFIALYWVGLPYLLASAIGYASGIAVSFVINRTLVFRSRGGSGTEAVRYAVVYLFALLAQLALLASLVLLGLGPLLANAIALVIVVILNFFAIRNFVFRAKPKVAR